MSGDALTGVVFVRTAVLQREVISGAGGATAQSLNFAGFRAGARRGRGIRPGNSETACPAGFRREGRRAAGLPAVALFSGSWVHLGEFDGTWLTRNFRWTGDISVLPRVGTEITAVRPVNVRADRFYRDGIRFDTDTPVVGGLEVGASVRISEIKDATEGYTDQGTYWVRIE